VPKVLCNVLAPKFKFFPAGNHLQIVFFNLQKSPFRMGTAQRKAEITLQTDRNHIGDYGQISDKTGINLNLE
jgi:hypothetical protein